MVNFFVRFFFKKNLLASNSFFLKEIILLKKILLFIFFYREMIKGDIPHMNLQLPQITAIVGYDESYKVKIPECHPKIAKIIELCLQKNPMKRPNFETIFKMVEEAEREINQKCNFYL